MTSIFIKSWKGDFEWLAYCLRSIQKFVTGYGEIVLALPSNHGLPLTKERVVIVDEWPGKAKPGAPSSGYYHQMFVKLCADKYCQGDFIMIVDSDCVFTRPFDVGEMFRAGRPMLLRRTWEEAGGGVQWREPAEHALGARCQYDTMVCHPAIYRRDDFMMVRERVERIHNVPFEHYVRSRSRFIEFVTIGNLILQTHPQDYAVIDFGPNDCYPRPLMQFWSWAGLDAPGVRAEIESILS